MTSDLAATDAAAPAGQTPAPSKRRSVLWYLIPLVILVDVIALIVSPPQNIASPEEACSFPACFVESTLHLPAPHVLVTADGQPVDTNMISAQLSITDSLLTMTAPRSSRKYIADIAPIGSGYASALWRGHAGSGSLARWRS